MKDTINEGGLPYITHHFIVLHPFLRRPQILLTFMSHLDLTKKISLLFEGVQIIPYFLAHTNCSWYLNMLTLKLFTYFLSTV